MKEAKKRVLIVEDSPTMQMLLKKIIEEDPRLEVIGIACDGKDAIEKVEYYKPDVITMDLFMPRIDGFEAIRRILQNHLIPIIVISGKYKKEDVEMSYKAIEAGAISILEKPPSLSDPNYKKIVRNITKSIFAVANLKIIRRIKHHINDENILQSYKKIETYHKGGKIRCLAIGASLGGPQALRELLSNIPKNFPIPIFLVQHISKGFTQGFADWLDSFTELTVLIPKDNDIARAGHVYVAPDEKHMKILKDNKICFTTHPNTSLMPSVSELFLSIANTYGSETLGIILTGMGSDGCQELLTLKNKGAITIVQSEPTCIATGMPGSAIKLKAARHVLALEEIAPFVKKIISCQYQIPIY